MEQLTEYSDLLSDRRNLVKHFTPGGEAYGDADRQIFNIHRGLDSLEYGIKPSTAKDSRKLVFFTRPQLNFTDKNIFANRKLLNLLNSNPSSIERYVRMMLDPRLAYEYIDKNGDKDQAKLYSPLVDSKNPFIPILSTALVKLSGWGDTVTPTYTSKPGIRKEVFTMVDGTNEAYGEYDLDATFRNTKGEAILKMMSVWQTIMGSNFADETMPYPDLLLELEKDYESRIYVIVLADDGKTIKRIAANNACFPITDPTGKFFDYDRAGNDKTENDEFTIRFKATGAMYNDPILAQEFNDTMDIFNEHTREMHEGKDAKTHGLVQVPPELHHTFNYNMYPVINLYTGELEWWTLKENIDIIRDRRET